MLQLLQPIWLYAMAGVAVPLMIHLWNNKQGKVLSIGSIAFLEKTSRQKARSRKISEWWLLALRCLLLILLALLLAGPYWKRTRDAAEKKGWVLVGGGVSSRLLPDSLIKAGYEQHIMTGNNWWAEFSALDRQAPAGAAFYVFTDGQLHHFQGQRPATNRPVYWQVDASRDSTVHWEEQTWQHGADSVEQISGSSRPTGTSYERRTIDRREAHGTVDTATLRVAIYTDEKYNSDGRWVAAAVRALQQFTGRSIKVSMGASGIGNADWIFWLSSQPLPADTRAANIFFYEQGREIPVDTWFGGSSVPVERRIAQTGPAEAGQPLWTDGFGRALLTMRDTAGGRRYHFFSHFDPAWNGLVWSADFPVRMQELLLDRLRGSQDMNVNQDAGERGHPGTNHDIRAIDPEQVAPAKGKPIVSNREVKENVDEEGRMGSIDLAPAGWLLIFIVVLTERILSFKKSKNA